jgi:hypothetical protein
VACRRPSRRTSRHAATRSLLSERLRVVAPAIHAYVLGGHGESAVIGCAGADGALARAAQAVRYDPGVGDRPPIEREDGSAVPAAFVTSRVRPS